MTARLPLSLRQFELVGVPALAALVGVLAAVLAYTTSPVVPLALAGGLVGVGLAFVRPVVALCFAIALVPFELTSVAFGGFGLTPAETMLALTAVGWAISRLARGVAPWSPSPLGRPLGLLVLAVVPGLAMVPDPFTVAKPLIFWTFFLLLYQMIVTEGDSTAVRWILLALGFSGAVVGAIAVSGAGAEQQTVVGFGEVVNGRATGAFSQPNILASFEAFALPAALALGLGSRVRWRPIALVLFGVTLAGLVLSLSRGGLLAVAGALLVMMVWPPFRRAALAAVAIVLVFVVTGTAQLGQVQQVDTLTQRLSSVSYSAEGVDPRFQIWAAVPHMFADHWVIGVGENEFSRYAPDYGLVNLNATGTFDHAHNIFFTIATELGVVGLLALLWFIVVLVGVLWRACARARGPDRGLGFAVAAGFFALFAQGMVDYTMRSNVIAAMIFILAGCAAVLARGGGPSPQRTSSR